MSEREYHDVVIIGAGINGIYQLYRLLEAGCDVVTLEAASGVGGTWFWNRYPGARLDSECYAYTYHFARELIDGWDWTEHFADQPTLERYFNYVVDRLELRPHIRFNTRVVSCEWQEQECEWHVTTDDGRAYRARFLVAAAGLLSAPYVPADLDVESFSGTVVHSTDWPAGGLDVTGKRVGVMGVGSTGIQIVQTVAPEVQSLVVFQRTANWATPLNNAAIDAEENRDLKVRSDEIYETTMSSRGCFLYTPQDRSTWDVTPEEREALYEDLYASPGMSLYQGGFNDVLIDQAANDEVVAFLTRKIRERVRDPEIARKLTPTHPYATRRPPLETNYFEVYNRENVDLVHLPEEPITRVTATGVDTTERHYPLDIIVLATGFDAITGSFLRLGLRGVDGVPLGDWWSAGPRSYLGIFVHGFPNLFILAGPQGVNGNLPRCTEFAVDWITQCIRSAQARGVDRIEARPEAEEFWVAQVNDLVAQTLLRNAASWAWGSNVPGKARAFTLYIGPQPEFRQRLREVADRDYEGLVLSKAGRPIGGSALSASTRSGAGSGTISPSEP